MTEPAVDRSGRGRRRWAILAALLWWGMALASIPYARRLIDLLRAQGLLVFTVTIAAAALFVAVVGAGARLRRLGVVTPRQITVATALLGAALLFVQLLPRPEDRWHALQYGILGATFWTGIKGEGLGRCVLAVLATGACGWLDEAVQFLVPSRVYDLWDAGLNAAAGVVGVGIVEVSRRTGSRKGA